LISDEDDRQRGRHAVAVVSYRFWKDKLNKSPTVIGQKLSFGGHMYDIIGVAEQQFFGVEVGKIFEIWTPISMAPSADLNNDRNFWLRTMGRLNYMHLWTQAFCRENVETRGGGWKAARGQEWPPYEREEPIRG
jgi:hypothetical protein